MTKNTKTRKSLATRLRLKIIYDDGKVERYSRTHPASVLHKIMNLTHFRRCEFRVIYYPDIDNSGTYTNKEDLLFAYQCFTSDNELKFIKKYWKDAIRPTDIYSKS
jgi:hypothetical protein